MILVLAHGVFDLFHIGHLQYLEAARKLGDRLMVTITADKYISKGPGRPLFNENHRQAMLQALRCVDLCEVLDEPTAVSGILKYRPDIYAKGMDYLDSQSEALELERRSVESYGGRLVITKTEIMCSSTEIMTGQLLKDRITTKDL